MQNIDIVVARQKPIMSEKRKVTIYTPEFRESSAKLAIESGRRVSQIDKELGINENTLHTWIAKYSKPKENAMRTMELNRSPKSNYKPEEIKV
jgi:transposase-like protein